MLQHTRLMPALRTAANFVGTEQDISRTAPLEAEKRLYIMARREICGPTQAGRDVPIA